MIAESGLITRLSWRSLPISRSIPMPTIIRKRTWYSRSLKARDPAAAAKIGDLTAEHRKGAKRLSQVAQAVENGLMDQGVSRHTLDGVIRDFIVHERHHMAMEEREFFPAAVEALQPQDWAEIASSRLTGQKDPLFSEIVEKRFDAVRRHILQLEQEAEAERAHF